MNKQIIILIIIVIILLVGAGVLGWLYFSQKKSLIQNKNMAINEAPEHLNYSAPVVPQKVIEERLMTDQEKIDNGIDLSVAAKIKIMTSPYNPDANITIIELPQ